MWEDGSWPPPRWSPRRRRRRRNASAAPSCGLAATSLRLSGFGTPGTVLSFASSSGSKTTTQRSSTSLVIVRARWTSPCATAGPDGDLEGRLGDSLALQNARELHGRIDELLHLTEDLSRATREGTRGDAGQRAERGGDRDEISGFPRRGTAMGAGSTGARRVRAHLSVAVSRVVGRVTHGDADSDRRRVRCACGRPG